MYRRAIAILILAGFVTLITGTGFLVHVYILHAGHGEDAHHDSSQCGFCQLVATATKAIVVDAPSRLFDLNASCSFGDPMPGAPELADAYLPIIPRAPPLTT